MRLRTRLQVAAGDAGAPVTSRTPLLRRHEPREQNHPELWPCLRSAAKPPAGRRAGSRPLTAGILRVARRRRPYSPLPAPTHACLTGND